MTVWDEKQSKLLGRLKKDFKKEKEAARERILPSSKFPQSRRGAQLEQLYSRLASEKEGIQYHISDNWESASLGKIDKVLFNIAANIGIGPRKIAIGLPRVPHGISTWLAVTIMISRIFLTKRVSVTKKIDLKKYIQNWIIIACRERSIRDLYLSQRILFSGRTFQIDLFPIFRFRLDGDLQTISYSVPSDLSSPVVFYHFDKILLKKSDLSELKVGLVFTEACESDSRLSKIMLERLQHLCRCFSEPKILLFFNSFDDQIREFIKQNEFKIIDIRPSYSRAPQRLSPPTIKGAFSCYSYPAKILPDIVKDDVDLSESLYESAFELVNVGKEMQSEECRRLVARWWAIWRILKDLIIPLNIYERYRMHAQGRGSLESAISQIVGSADRISTDEGRLLQSVAPVIGNRLQVVYNKLTQSHPKAERLKSLMKEAKSDSLEKTLFLMSEKSQVDAFREHLLFTDIELLDELRMIHLVQAGNVARKMIVTNCVLPGVWAPWQDSTLIAIGASMISVLMYPYEASLLKTRIQEHYDECALLVASLSDNQSYAPILSLSQQQQEFLNNFKKIKKERPKVLKPPDWLKTAHELIVDPTGSEDKILEDEHPTEGLAIVFGDGSSIVVRPHSEMLLITEDGVESVFADTLEPGDKIAVMKEDITRSIFHSVLAQVNHLIKVDSQVIELWRSSIRKALYGDETIVSPRPISDIIRDLRSLGCFRVELTIRQWFKGTTLAPEDPEDIQRVLELAGIERALEVSKVISREIEVIRTFNRRLGKRIRSNIKGSIVGEELPPIDRIDFEIDEAIEAVEYKTVDSTEIFMGGYH